MKRPLTPEQQAEIAELEKRINEIKEDTNYNYALIKIIPDCGAGIADKKTIIVIAAYIDKLQDYCHDIMEYPYLVEYNGEKPKELSPCDTWYRIELTKIDIVI